MVDRRTTARVLLIDHGKILLMRREYLRDGKMFSHYLIPGGTVEGNETLEETAVREIKEETNFDIELGDFIATFSYIDPTHDDVHNIFSCNSFSGEMKLGGPELQVQSETNRHILEWVKISELERLKVSIWPTGVKEKIVELYNK